MKRLTRSNEKQIAGVVSGISNYINPEWDPVFLRLAVIWLTFYNPALILIYIGLIFVIPVEHPQFTSSKATSTSAG